MEEAAYLALIPQVPGSLGEALIARRAPARASC